MQNQIKSNDSRLFFFGRRSCLAVYRVSRQPFSDSLQNFDDVDEALQSGVHDWDGVEKINSSEKQAKWNSDSKWCCNFESRRLNFPSHAQIDVAAAAVDCPMSFVRTLINDCIVRTQRQTEISCGCIKNMGRWLKIGTKKKKHEAHLTQFSCDLWINCAKKLQQQHRAASTASAQIFNSLFGQFELFTSHPRRSPIIYYRMHYIICVVFGIF